MWAEPTHRCPVSPGGYAANELCLRSSYLQGTWFSVDHKPTGNYA